MPVDTAVELGAGDANPTPGAGGSHGPPVTGTETVEVPSDIETVVAPPATGVTITLDCVPDPDTAASAMVASAIVTASAPRAFDTERVVGAVVVPNETVFGRTVSGPKVGGDVGGGDIGGEVVPHAANALAKQTPRALRYMDIVYSR